MLLTLLNEVDHSLSELQIEHLATVTHGFVGADLAALCNEAALVCLRRYVNFKKDCDDFCYNGTSIPCKGYFEDIAEQPALLKGARNLKDYSAQASSSVSNLSLASNFNTEIIPDSGEEEHILKVTYEDFQKARMKVRPSAMREVRLMM